MIFMYKIRHIGILIDDENNLDFIFKIRSQLMYENIKVLFTKDIIKGAIFLYNKGIKYLIVCSKNFENKEKLNELKLPVTILPKNETTPQNFAHNIEQNLNFLDLQTNDKGIGYTDIYYTNDFDDVVPRIDNKKLNTTKVEKLD